MWRPVLPQLLLSLARTNRLHGTAFGRIGDDSGWLAGKQQRRDAVNGKLGSRRSSSLDAVAFIGA